MVTVFHMSELCDGNPRVLRCAQLHWQNGNEEKSIEDHIKSPRRII